MDVRPLKGRRAELSKSYGDHIVPAGENLRKEFRTSVVSDLREGSDLEVHSTRIQAFQFMSWETLIKKVFSNRRVRKVGWPMQNTGSEFEALA